MYSAIADKLKDGSKVILVHGNADMDAIGSAYAIARAFGNGTIFAPDGIDRVSRMVAEKLGIEVAEECDLSHFDKVVVVDTSSPDQLVSSAAALPRDAIVIDHHMPTGRWDGYDYHCDDTMISCTEIALRIIRAAGIPLERDVALALLGGMITDGGHFQFANSRMLRDFADVMDEAGIEMGEAMALTRATMSMSERVAMMKCVERSKFDRVGDMIVATSYGGSFEASGCRALLSSGADVVFVATQREDSFRVSARATQEAVRKGIHLGNIMKNVGVDVTADGGGHSGAAGISGIGDCEAILHICMHRTMDEFREIKKRGNPESGIAPSD